jgi:hypothetical protein
VQGAAAVERAPAVPAALIGLGVIVLGGSLAVGGSSAAVPVAVLMVLAGLAATRPYVSWRTAVIGLILTILFVPIRRYTFPLNLPFQLEPYRVLVALIVGGWVLSLLADPRVRARRSGFEGPVLVVLVATMGSVVVNGDRVAILQQEVVKSVTFFSSFLFVYYLLVGVTRGREAIDVIVRVLVGGGAVVAVLAIVESRTGFSPFGQLERYVPFLSPIPTHETLARGWNIRAQGPAEHPIALGAALMLLTPLAVYLVAAKRQARWWIALVLLPLGALATHSRTGILMLVMIVVVFLVLRPREVRRQWPLALVLVVATHFLMPGAMGTLRATFFPEGGLIASQKGGIGHQKGYSCSGSGRIADLGPAFEEASRKPLLGYGYGTRIVNGEKENACILDNQWLSTLLETGLVGGLGWLWLFVHVVRRLGRAARADRSPPSWLEVALAASLSAAAVGMLTFDAFGFIQFTFLLFILVGLASATLHARSGPSASVAVGGDALPSSR